MTRLSLAEVNSLEEEQFVWVFKNVIELHEAAARRVQDKRPFQTLPDLCAAFHKYLDDLPVEEQLHILMLHPDLAGRLAAQGALTAESTKEQQSAGLDTLTKEQKSIIDTFNERYRSKFGFPFIICARENKVQAIIEGLQARYINTREEEVKNGINEVKKICRLRITDIVQN